MARLTPLNGKDAATVTKAMMDDMYTFGVPHTVVTDQGPEFVSQMQKILFDSLNRKVTTGYHPRFNGAAEQFNKIMVSNIKAQMQQQGKSTLDWEQCLAPLMFNYNTSINKSTKITPFHATFN
jgi:transposase InsO family protein